MIDQPDDGSPARDLRHYRLAGFSLAHALGSIDPGGTLCTLAFAEIGDTRTLFRFEADSIAASVDEAIAFFRSELGAGDRAALVYDGYATIDGIRTDALRVDLLGPGGAVVGRLLQRYRPARFGPLGLLRLVGIPVPGGVAVIGPPIADEDLPPSAQAALTDGIVEHPRGPGLLRLEPE